MIPACGRQPTYEQSRSLAGLLGRIVTDELPEIATMTRPIAGAPVSTPRRLDPARHTLRTVPSRRLKKDPVAPVLTQTPDLLAALARLRDRIGA